MNRIIQDYKDEHFTLREWLVYGLVWPTVMLTVCIIADAILTW